MAGNNRDFAWFTEELQRQLRAKQQAADNPSIDMMHVLRDLPPETLASLDEPALAQAYETYKTAQGEAGNRFRALVSAEQERRRSLDNRRALRKADWALVVAVIGILIAAVSLGLQFRQVG